MTHQDSTPSSWLSLQLGEVIDYGQTEKVEPDNISSEIWVLELEDIERDTSRILQRLTFAERPSKSTKNSFSPGDILYGKLRPYLNKVIYADAPGVCSTEIIPLKPNLAVNSRYLFHWTRHPEFLAYTSQVSHGVNMPRLGTEAGRQAPFILAPINEQRRIADKLDRVLARVDAANEHLSRVAPLIKRFRQSVLAAATSGRLTEDTSTTSRQVMLQDVALDFSYGSSEKSKPHGKVPVLRMGNIQGGSINWSDLVFTDNESEIAKYELTYGDVLFNRTNSPELVGKTAIYDQGPRAIYAGYLIRIKCTEELNPFYLNYCLNSPMGRAYCWSVKSDGVSQSNINAKKLAAFSFRLPSIEEQAEIVRRVEKLFAFADRLEEHLSQAQAAVQKLTPALLAKAFRGELVPQDPNDEPASELLKRLQESRTESAKPSRARKPRARKSP